MVDLKDPTRLLAQVIREPSFRPPILPRVVREAVQMARTGDPDIGRLVDQLAQDPALAAKVVGLANSSLYRRGVPAASLLQAVTRIGLENTRDLLVYSQMETYFFRSHRFERENEQLRRHALAASCAARYLAQVCLRMPHSDELGLVALVHDIGAAALLRHIDMRLEGFFVSGRVLAVTLEALHERAGGVVARAWHLPDHVATLIEEHSLVRPSDTTAKLLLAAADHLASLCGFGMFEQTQDWALDALLAMARPVRRVVEVVPEVARRLRDLELV